MTEIDWKQRYMQIQSELSRKKMLAARRRQVCDLRGITLELIEDPFPPGGENEGKPDWEYGIHCSKCDRSEIMTSGYRSTWPYDITGVLMYFRRQGWAFNPNLCPWEHHVPIETMPLDLPWLSIGEDVAVKYTGTRYDGCKGEVKGYSPTLGPIYVAVDFEPQGGDAGSEDWTPLTQGGRRWFTAGELIKV